MSERPPEFFPPGTTVIATKGRAVVLALPDEDHLAAVLVRWDATGQQEWIATDNLRRSQQP
jgi:hypothetical protein